MQRSDARELFLQRLARHVWHHRHPILASLSAAHANFAADEIEVLDPESQALEQAESGTVQEQSDQVCDALELIEHPSHLSARQHRRQPGGRGRSQYAT